MSNNRGRSSKGPIGIGLLFIIAAVLLTRSSWFSARMGELVAWDEGHGSSSAPARPGGSAVTGTAAAEPTSADSGADSASSDSGAAPAPDTSSSGSAAPNPDPASSSSAAAMGSVHSPGAVATDIDLQPGQCHTGANDAASGSYLPDPACTPGAIDPAVTQDNISSTICARGYTATIRPPASVTGKFKTASLADYGLPHNKTTEYDHLISLELGGTNSVKNLWPEPNRSAATGTTNPKDAIENRLNKAICGHEVTLAAAQHAIAGNWTTAESVLGITP